MTLTEQLVQLAGLYSSGLLSADEYRQAKRIVFSAWAEPENTLVDGDIAGSLTRAPHGEEPREFETGVSSGQSAGLVTQDCREPVANEERAAEQEPSESEEPEGVQEAPPKIVEEDARGEGPSPGALPPVELLTKGTSYSELSKEEIMRLLESAAKRQSSPPTKGRSDAPKRADEKVMALGPTQFDALKEIALGGGCVRSGDLSYPSPDRRSKASGSHKKFTYGDFKKLQSAGLLRREDGSKFWRLTDDGWLFSGVSRP